MVRSAYSSVHLWCTTRSMYGVIESTFIVLVTVVSPWRVIRSANRMCSAVRVIRKLMAYCASCTGFLAVRRSCCFAQIDVPSHFSISASTHVFHVGISAEFGDGVQTLKTASSVDGCASDRFSQPANQGSCIHPAGTMTPVV